LTLTYNSDIVILFNSTDNLGIDSCWIVIIELTDSLTFDDYRFT